MSIFRFSHEEFCQGLTRGIVSATHVNRTEQDRLEQSDSPKGTAAGLDQPAKFRGFFELATERLILL